MSNKPERSEPSEARNMDQLLSKHPPTECCSYEVPLELPYPVMWNEHYKVVQCHNCGQQYKSFQV